MPTTSNFGWTTPADTDLVKDGAAAIRTLGNGIDTSLVDLKGGTTGQVLSKASNTDLDYTWVTTDDANAIQNAIVDAKGDLIAASAADTPARLAVGNNGETLVADSAATVGLRYQANFAAGKNKIINGDFNIWQRGTTFNNAANEQYTADRFVVGKDGTATVNVTRETFTPGSAPVAGYESQYFLKFNVSAWTSAANYLIHRIEDVRTFAGQTITVSFWAKADASFTNTILYGQAFGSGGSATVTGSSTVTIGTDWTRHSVNFNLPSISGKTIGAGSFLFFQLLRFEGVKNVDIWGVQVEAGSVATAFQTATGTLQGELAACQRYFQRLINGADSNNEGLCTGQARSTTGTCTIATFLVPMRSAPSFTASAVGHFAVTDSIFAELTVTVLSFEQITTRHGRINATVASGLTAGNASVFKANVTASATLDVSAEL